MGRPSRLLSKQMLAAYGPLQGGLRMEHYTLPQLLRIVQHHCTRLQGTTALELHHTAAGYSSDSTPAELPLTTGPEPQLPRHALFAALPTAFRRLRSLSLRGAWHHSCTSHADLQLLAPLGSSLTALTVRMEAESSLQPAPVTTHPLVAAGGWPLTSLRHLDITFADCWLELPSEEAAHWLGCLALMPHLVKLDLRLRSIDASVSAAQWLPGLAQAVPRLTSLRLCTTATWDGPALAALQHGLPALAALSISLFAHPQYQPDPINDVLAVLARRTALALLALDLSLDGDELLQPLPTGLQAPDWKLDLRFKYSDVGQSVWWLLEALQAQTALTSLEITCSQWEINCNAGVLHRSLLALPLTLRKLSMWCCYRDFDPACLMEGIARQPQLEELHLSSCDITEWPEGVAARLSSMTRLRALRLSWSCFPGSFMQVVAALTQLEELEVRGPRAAQEHFEDSALQHLQHLQQLTRLQLLCDEYIQGPGLTVLQHMGALHELDLELDEDVYQQMGRWLLPLPPKLHKLAFRSMDRPDDEVLAAAKLQGCVVIGGCRYSLDAAFPWHEP
jgi:hypothetical protein